jgi:ribosomally synthesized peptide (Cys-rich family)
MSESIEQIREKAKEIATRLSADPDFKAQIEHDPEGTLVAAGLPVTAVPDFLSEVQLADVSGYLVSDCSFTCVITCVTSSCTLASLIA